MASVETLSKGEQERRRLRPIGRGAHSIREFVQLRKQGHAYHEIAKLWGMRPIAGATDLEFDVWLLWQSAGAPGSPPRPPPGPRVDDMYRGPDWDAWRAGRLHAMQAWLDTFADAAPPPHCETCRCGG